MITIEESNEELEKILDSKYIRVGPLSWESETMLVVSGVSIPNGRIVDNIIFLPKADAIVERLLDSNFKRLSGLKWAIVANETIIKKATHLIRSVASPKASQEIIEKRKESCFSCPALKVENGKKYCGACGCGKWLLAELDGGISPKLEHSVLNCPLKRPGFSNSK